MIIKAVLFLWLVIFCFFGCKQDQDVDLSLSGQAIQYSYPEDNILSLRSVTTDYGGEINRLIIEFGDSSDYVKKKELDSIVKAMKENSDRIWEKIVGVVDEYTDSKDVEIKFSNNSIFIILHFKTNEECKYVKIRQQFNTLLLIGPWDDPEIEVVYYHTIKEGTEGDLYIEQDYNEVTKKWDPSYEQFVEEMPPVLD